MSQVTQAAEELEAFEPASEEKNRKLVIFAASGDLERTWASLILATSGAAMGMQTTIFYTFWGLFSLVKNDKKKGRGRRFTGENWMQKMLSVLNHGGTEHLKLSRMNFAGMGPWMIGRLAKQYKDSTPSELIEMAKDMGVRLIPCQMTMDLMGLTREDLIDGLEEPAGATSALLEAQDAITLFI